MKILVPLTILFLALTNFLYGQCSNPYAGPDTSFCGMAQLSVENATIGYWKAYVDGEEMSPSPNFFPSNTNHDVSVVIPYYEGNNISVDFVWTDESGPCDDLVTVIFAKNTLASVGPDNIAEVCGNEFIFNADTTGFGWAQYNWSSPTVDVVINNPELPNASVYISNNTFGDSARIHIPFVWTCTNYACQSTDTMFMIFYQRPEAYAGEDRAVCGKVLSAEAEYSVGGSEDYSPECNWSIYSKPNPEAEVSINSNDEADAHIIVSDYGIWEMIFQEYNAYLPSCYDTDTVLYEFIEIPLISAGEDIDVCGNCFNLSAISSGFDGMWISDNCELNDLYNPETEVCCSFFGSQTFMWKETNYSTISDHYCVSGDEVVVTMYREPEANIITELEDSLICGLNTGILEAMESEYGFQAYWISDNEEVEFSDEYSINPNVTVPNTGSYSFYLIEENGPVLIPGFCRDTAGPITLYFLNDHPLNAGQDTDVFGLDHVLVAVSDADSEPFVECAYFWGNENAVFSNENELVTTVTVPEYGQYDFILNSYFINMEECFDSDTVKINFRNPDEQGIADAYNESIIAIYPNPVFDQLLVDTELVIKEVTISAINGNIVCRLKNPEKRFGISNLEPGVYFIQIQFEDSIATGKFIKQ